MELSVNGGSKKNSWVIMEKHTKMEDSGVPPFQETFIMYIMYIYIYLIIYIYIFIYIYIIKILYLLTTDEIGSLTFEAPTSGGALFTPL